jgi:hypothetical protein
MIINYLHFVDIALLPNKANSPTVIDSDTILPQAISPESFQSVSRRDSQIFEGSRPVGHAQFAQADSLNFQGQFT